MDLFPKFVVSLYHTFDKVQLAGYYSIYLGLDSNATIRENSPIKSICHNSHINP
jgi:hypothetical protein